MNVLTSFILYYYYLLFSLIFDFQLEKQQKISATVEQETNTKSNYKLQNAKKKLKREIISNLKSFTQILADYLCWN